MCIHVYWNTTASLLIIITGHSCQITEPHSLFNEPPLSPAVCGHHSVELTPDPRSPGDNNREIRGLDSRPVLFIKKIFVPIISGQAGSPRISG